MWSPRTEEEYSRKDNIGTVLALQGWFGPQRKGSCRSLDGRDFLWFARSELVCRTQASRGQPSAAARSSWWLGMKASRGSLCAGVGGGGSPEGDHQVRMGLQSHERMHVWGHGWGQVWPDVLRSILLTDCEAGETSGRSPFLLQCSSITFC